MVLLKELGELNSPHDEHLIETSTKDYLQTALSNEFISYMAEKNGEPVSISGLVLFKRLPYLENLKGIEAYILNMYAVPQYRMEMVWLEDCLNNVLKKAKKWELNGFGCTHLRMESSFIERWVL